METWEEPSARARQGLWLYTCNMNYPFLCPFTGVTSQHWICAIIRKETRSNLYNLPQRTCEMFPSLSTAVMHPKTLCWKAELLSAIRFDSKTISWSQEGIGAVAVWRACANGNLGLWQTENSVTLQSIRGNARQLRVLILHESEISREVPCDTNTCTCRCPGTGW